ncbi:MAG: hypothetical protein P8X73_00745 [Ignavibacteriaceae bacterium]
MPNTAKFQNEYMDLGILERRRKEEVVSQNYAAAPCLRYYKN